MVTQADFSCLRMRSRVCKSTASDSCRVGKAFLVGICFSTGRVWCQPSKHTPNKKPILAALFSPSEGEFQSKKSNILLSFTVQTPRLACSRVELAQPQLSAVSEILHSISYVFCSQGSLYWGEVVDERILHALLILQVACLGDIYVSAIILAIKLQPWKCFHLGWFHLPVAMAMQRSVMGNVLLDL